MNQNDQIGTLVLVHPEMDKIAGNHHGKIGVVNYVDQQENYYVGFPDGTNGVLPGMTLFQLKNKEKIFSDLMGNASRLEVKDFKDLYKISVLLDQGRNVDLIRAMEIARDNPEIWKGSLSAMDNSMARLQTVSR